eukprot:s15_g27.t1
MPQRKSTAHSNTGVSPQQFCWACICFLGTLLVVQVCVLVSLLRRLAEIQHLGGEQADQYASPALSRGRSFADPIEPASLRLPDADFVAVASALGAGVPKPLSVVRLSWPIAGLICSHVFAMAGGYPMDFCDVDTGSGITVVCKVISFDPMHESHMLKAVHNGMTFFLQGLLEAGYDTYTICDAVLLSHFPVPRLMIGDNTRIMKHATPTWNDFHKMIDACCGIGGIAHGASAVGIQATVCVDMNSKMTGLHAAHSVAEPIVGDIGNEHVIFNTWLHSDNAAVLMGGFSCQPFSRLGDQRSGSDSRASSLPNLLKAAFFLQVKVVGLECVLPAKTDKYVNDCINHFLRITGFHKTQVDLRLEHVWPCRRGRSWWLLTAPELGPIPLEEMPVLESIRTIGHVIPLITQWDPRDELALRLDVEEQEVFGVTDGSFHKYLMNKEGHAPCSLHAYGSQIKPCPCGCRSAGLSRERLHQKGLFALLVHTHDDAEGLPCVRHIHPNECLALNAMDPTIDFGLNVRLTLSGVGQIASPLQAAWILSFLMCHLEKLRFGNVLFDPNAQLQAFRSWLLMKCRQVWPCASDFDVNCPTHKLAAFWKEHTELSLEQLMHPPNWNDMLDRHVTIAAILDCIIRHVETVPKPPVTEDEIPQWCETLSVVETPSLLPPMSASQCMIVFTDHKESPVCFSFKCGSTVGDVIQAHNDLIGVCSTVHVSDSNGVQLSQDHVLEVGQTITMTCDSLNRSDQGECGLLPRMPCEILPETAIILRLM